MPERPPEVTVTLAALALGKSATDVGALGSEGLCVCDATDAAEALFFL